MRAYEWSSHLLQSSSLNARVVFRLVLPQIFSSAPQSNSDRIPLLLLLHGVHGAETDWIDQGDLIQTMNRLHDEGIMGPIAILTPSDGLRGIGTGYLNWSNADHEHRYEDYLLQDLLRHVEERWPVGGVRDKRGICGLSMGGYAAIRLALSCPEMWASASSLSGFFEIEELGSLVGEDTYARIVPPTPNDLHSLSPLRMPPIAGVQYPDLLFDCGAADPYMDQNRRLSRRLSQYRISHRFFEKEGTHNWEYWRAGLSEHLAFHFNCSQGGNRS